MQKIKERLFGILVLLSLGIIFIPMLVPQSNKKLNITDMQMNIPEVDSSILPIVEPESVALLKQLEKPAVQAHFTVQETTLTTAPKQPVSELQIKSSVEEVKIVANAKNADLQSAWAVQLGAFQDTKNANKLIKKLQKSGYPAYAKEIQNTQGAFTLVLIGPKAQEKEALILKQTLESEYQLKGMIVQYQPVVS